MKAFLLFFVLLCARMAAAGEPGLVVVKCVEPRRVVWTGRHFEETAEVYWLLLADRRIGGCCGDDDEPIALAWMAVRFEQWLEADEDQWFYPQD